MMKLIALVLILSCAAVYSFEYSEEPKYRVRRAAQEPIRGTITVHGQQKLTGKDRRPSLDVNYNHRVLDGHRTNANAYGGVNLQSGKVSPHAGIRAEHTFSNGAFVHGFGQAQPGRRGGVAPTFGAGVGYRW